MRLSDRVPTLGVTGDVNPLEATEETLEDLPSVLDRILARGEIRCLFQPIVDLATGETVGYEALTRGPHGPLETPDVLFATARDEGRLVELDELCRRTAVLTALTIGISAPLTLLINVEPAALRPDSLDELIGIVNAAPNPPRLVLEITERALDTDPAALLATVRRLRAAGWRIALDDVGAEDMSLTFMSVLRPDIIKIDMGVVQRHPDAAAAEIMNAVNAHAERTGCVLLAEGVENSAHLMASLALGAQLGQGWKFGGPTPTVPRAIHSPSAGLDLPTPGLDAARSPFELRPRSIRLRQSTKPLLIEVSKHIERQALALGRIGIIVGTFQHARHFTARTRRRYTELANRLGFVAAMGADLETEPSPGVRGAALAAEDELCNEWDVVVLSPHFAAALIARDLGDGGADSERRFEFVLTYDREVVTVAAESLISRILPIGPVTPETGSPRTLA